MKLLTYLRYVVKYLDHLYHVGNIMHSTGENRLGRFTTAPPLVGLLLYPAGADTVDLPIYLTHSLIYRHRYCHDYHYEQI